MKSLVSSDMSGPHPVWWRRALGLVFALAMLVRVTGLYWGGVYYDEAFGRGAKVLSGQLVPDQLWYPPLLDYLNAVAYAALYGLGRLVGVWSDTAAFRDQYFNNRTPFILTARLVTAIFGCSGSPVGRLDRAQGAFAVARGRVGRGDDGRAAGRSHPVARGEERYRHDDGRAAHHLGLRPQAGPSRLEAG